MHVPMHTPMVSLWSLNPRSLAGCPLQAQESTASRHMCMHTRICSAGSPTAHLPSVDTGVQFCIHNH